MILGGLKNFYVFWVSDCLYIHDFPSLMSCPQRYDSGMLASCCKDVFVCFHALAGKSWSSGMLRDAEDSTGYLQCYLKIWM